MRGNFVEIVTDTSSALMKNMNLPAINNSTDK